MATPDKLLELLFMLNQRPLDAVTLCQRLGLSQPVFSRLVQVAGEQVIRIGAARSTRYARLRPIRELGSLFPVFVVDADGQITPWGELRTLQNSWHVFVPWQQAGAGGPAKPGTPQLLEGLPWWLQDLRPQGFLGRSIPVAHPDLSLPADILSWSDDDTLYYLLRRGEAVIGNIVIGNESALRYRQFNDAPIPGQERLLHYDELARRANQGDIPGSSAAGEQPKFTCAVAREDGRIESVIVKFSADLATPNGRRWGDLLIAEHLALLTLRENGFSACVSEVVTSQLRVYLEVVRFDRLGARGRAPMVSMAGVDGLLGALDKNWTNSTQLLLQQRRLSDADWQQVRVLDLFGALIGNTDRHPGNLSLTWQHVIHGGRFSLAPVYDMLPMMYQPNRQGELVPREFDLSILNRLDLQGLPQALPMACQFWQSVQDNLSISDDFKGLAARHLQQIRRL